jgi:hypothetical protein
MCTSVTAIHQVRPSARSSSGLTITALQNGKAANFSIDQVKPCPLSMSLFPLPHPISPFTHTHTHTHTHTLTHTHSHTPSSFPLVLGINKIIDCNAHTPFLNLNPPCPPQLPSVMLTRRLSTSTHHVCPSQLPTVMLTCRLSTSTHHVHRNCRL